MQSSHRVTAPPVPRTIDLHAHTTASDGLLAPSALVELAVARGIRSLAVTDHDTTGGVAEAMTAGRALGVTVIPGVEINTTVAGHEVHILGYFIDYRHPQLQAFFAEQRIGRERRATRMVENLQALGMPLSLDAVRAEAQDAPLGRPHVARAMVAAGYARSVPDAFLYWLRAGRPAYVARTELTPQTATGVIRRFGGVPVLAHPASLLDLESWVARLSDVGLAGLECYYPGYRPAVRSALLALARRYQLIPTGGSDFHSPDRRRGILLGSVAVPPETPALLLARAETSESAAVAPAARAPLAMLP